MCLNRYCPKVLVIILNWNNPSDTLECLNSVLSLEYFPYRVLVVDNGSTDDSIELFHAWALNLQRTWACYGQDGVDESDLWLDDRPVLLLLEAGENLGYAGGNNRGLEVALDLGADYAFILNNDTTVSPDSLTWLVQAAESDPGVAMVGGKILFHDDSLRIYAAGVEYAWGKGTVCVGRGALDEGQYDVPRLCDSLNGSALLVKCRTLREVGSFDESYFLVLEETDLCYRMRAKDYRLVYEPKAKIFHKGGGTADRQSPTMLYYTRRNALRFVYDYKGRTEFMAFFVRFLLASLWKCLSHFMRGHFAQVQAICKAYVDFFGHRYGRQAVTFDR